MKLELIRPYGIKRVGDTLNSVPFQVGKRLIERGIAVLVEEKVSKNANKNKRRTSRRAGNTKRS